MQTWMTRMSFLGSAADLTLDHLALQAAESRRLLLAMLIGEEEDGAIVESHPLFKMWAGYETALAAHAASCYVELARRGVIDNGHFIVVRTMRELRRTDPAPYEEPPWLNDTDFLTSHRSNLARRWPTEYGRLFKASAKDMPYLWPIVDDQGGYGLYVSKHDKELLASGERTLSISIKNRVENL